jgi:hypothetical protein
VSYDRDVTVSDKDWWLLIAEYCFRIINLCVAKPYLQPSKLYKTQPELKLTPLPPVNAFRAFKHAHLAD